jgi:CIC family chloride channel protein
VYALVGMGAGFAGIVRTLITSVIMIFEMTRDYSIIVPLMISNLISFFVSHRLQRQPIYDALAHQEGVYLPGAESREQLSRLRVQSVVRIADEPLPAETDLPSAIEYLQRKELNAWPVARGERLLGLLTTRLLDGDGIESKAAIGELFDGWPAYAYVHPDQSLSIALERMGAAGVDALPVVSRADIRRLLGVITLPEVLRAYGLQPVRHAPG